jgi:hypothetical protein
MAHAQKPGFVFQTHSTGGRLRLKCDGTRAETRFRLSAKRTSPFKSVGSVSSVYYWQASRTHQPAGFVLLVQACVLQSRDAYWLPTPSYCFPFTSPPVRRRVPSHFNWTLLKACRVNLLQKETEDLCVARHRVTLWNGNNILREERNTIFLEGWHWSKNIGSLYRVVVCPQTLSCPGCERGTHQNGFHKIGLIIRNPSICVSKNIPGTNCMESWARLRAT